MVFYRGPFSQSLKLVVSIKMSQKENGLKKSVRVYTPSVFSKTDFKIQFVRVGCVQFMSPGSFINFFPFLHGLKCLPAATRKKEREFVTKISKGTRLLHLCRVHRAFGAGVQSPFLKRDSLYIGVDIRAK